MLERMRFEFCIPTAGTRVPHTPDWLHEIKYDGYRLRVERDGDRWPDDVRLSDVEPRFTCHARGRHGAEENRLATYARY